MRAICGAALALVAGPAFACPSSHVFMNVANAEGAGPNYPRPRVAAQCEAGALVIRANGIPHYRFVPMTPNPLVEQDYVIRLPLDPKRAPQQSRIPLLGATGIAINGIVTYGPNEAAHPAPQAWGDPVHNRIVDKCFGHTAGEYHYHALSQDCLAPGSRPGQPSPILGYGFDGFAIYGPYGCMDRQCRTVVKFKSGWVRIGDPTRNAWDAYEYRASSDPTVLDRCNGRVGPDGVYRYHATDTFPYIMGCYAGTQAVRLRAPPPRAMGPGPGGPGR